MKKIIAGSVIAGIVALSFAASVFAAKPASNLLATNWRVYNIMPSTAKLWDINKLATNDTFPIQQFDTTTTGSFAVYVLNNYNVDMTGKTITADVNWTAGTYVTRGAASDGAYVRLEFQDVTAGPYNSNDYWWSTVNLNLNLNTGSSGTLTASLTDCTLWTNQNGLSACDNTTVNWTDWQGNLIAESPAVGFANAVKNVKQVGLSFGRASSYASGVALVGGTGTFTMSSFTIAQ